MIASYEEKIAYYESLKTEWDNLLAKYTEDTYTQLLIGAFGNDFENELLNGRTGRWTQFAEDYYNIQVQLKDVTDQIESLAKRMEDYASRIESAANSALSAVKKLKETEAETSSSGWYTGGWTSAIKSSKKAKGGIITKEDEGDLDFVANSLGEDHMVALTEGEAVIPKETVVKNPEAIDSLLSGKKLDLENYTAIREGVEIKRPEWTIADDDKTFTFAGRQITMKEFNALSEQLANRIQNTYPTFHRDVLNSMAVNKPFDYGNVPMNNGQQRNVTVEFKGDIVLQGVQDVNGLARDIKHKLAGVVNQELNRR